MLRLAEADSAWWKTKKPLDEDLKKMHIEFLDWPESGIPLGFFMFHDILRPDSEAFVGSALLAAAGRSQRSPQELARLAGVALADATAGARLPRPKEETVVFAVLVAEALQLVPNSFPYMPDSLDTNARGARHVERKRKPSEFFNAAARVCRSGDCEDLAREMVTVAASIVRGTWSTPLVQAAQAVLRCYLVSLQLGCIEKPPAERALGSNDPYSTGSYDAHAWVMMVPTLAAAQMLEGSQVEEAHPLMPKERAPLLLPWVKIPWVEGGCPLAQARLTSSTLSPWTKYGLPVMSMDGTKAKEVYPRHAIHAIRLRLLLLY
jgi:hypothetical protein